VNTAQSRPSKDPKFQKVARTRKPLEMTLEEWQIALRRNFGREQKLKIKELDESLFQVANPTSGGKYQVRIRGRNLGENHCTCPDFEINTLGTCKHVEFVLGKLERKRNGKILSLGEKPPRHGELLLRYGAKREVFFRPGATTPLTTHKIFRRFFGEDGTLKPESYLGFDQFLKKARESDPKLRCQDEALSFISQVRDQYVLRQRVAKHFPDGAESSSFKALLKTTLYPYQRSGALFAASAGRCVIADDMGLGKTIQAIAGAEILAQTMGIEKVLIVCPTSLKHQWKQEIEKLTNRTSEILEGTHPVRKLQFRSHSFFKIINYDVIHRDQALIQEWAPDLIILDEAQRIKNWKTRTAKSVKQLPSEYAFVLTGTPLENRLEELHSIVEFVDRFHLGPSFRFLSEHQILDEQGKVIGYQNLTKISETLKPILIRRTKDQVLKQLPKRMDKNLFVPMTQEQMAYHQENQEVVAKIVQKWKRLGFLTEKDQKRLMIALQFMRMSCNSTYLMDGRTDHGVKADELKNILGESLETPDTKVVIFSQWIKTHELIIRRLEKMKLRGGKKLGFVFLHGGLSSQERRKIIQRFKEDPDCRIFLSTDAGGVGLNLQAASVVVNMDLPWNPAVLEQRIGRVHRLGQVRPVRVINFVSEGTIEQGMLKLLSFKKSLFAGALDGGQDEVLLGGTRLTRFMESVEKVSDGIEKTDRRGGSEQNHHDESGVMASTSIATSATNAIHPKRPQTLSPNQTVNELVSAGITFLEKLSSACQGNIGAGLTSMVARDSESGQDYLKLPLPSADAIQSLGSLLQKLGEAFRPR
jgi:superfamily II DNA/RNA helicase